MDQDVIWDVVVAGAGNAGMCAALAAREQGASVLVLEKAPFTERGGNSAFTGGLFRFPYQGLDDLRVLLPDTGEAELATADVGSYPRHQFTSDLEQTAQDFADPVLIDALVSQSYPTMVWMHQQGMRWMLAFGRQSYKVADRNVFYGNLPIEANGGGRGHSDRQFELAQARGVDVWYEAKAHRLFVGARGEITGLEVRHKGHLQQVSARTVVLATGGFEANPEMRARYLGPGWDLVKIRGTRFNTGDGIRMGLDIGAQPCGHWSSGSSEPTDLMTPPVGDLRMGDLYQKHSYPLGIMVNRLGQRFVDEGSDLRNYTYAKVARAIMVQPDRMAFQIFDRKTIPLLRDEYRVKDVTRETASTVEELADRLDISSTALKGTIQDFNAAIQPGEFNPSIKDGKATRGLDPPKSNWALPIDEPPFEAYAVTCALTFTFGGLKTDGHGAVLDTEDQRIPGLYAAGELVGGLFYFNYVGGTGLMSGSVFGRLAGNDAAEYALASENRDRIDG